jgi:hypothetical protein
MQDSLTSSDQIRDQHRKKRAKLWKQFWILLAIFLILGTGVYNYLGIKEKQLSQQKTMQPPTISPHPSLKP